MMKIRIDMSDSEKKELRQRAFDSCAAPFERVHGYIFDANGNTISDDTAEGIVTRMRGWGRLHYLDKPEELQDAIGDLIVEALNEFWEKHAKKD